MKLTVGVPPRTREIPAYFWVVLCFGLVYSTSLTFVYVTGGDAASIAYHLLGRNATIQPPYSVYQSFMDFILGLLPPNEAVLRMAAISMTAFSALAFTLGIFNFSRTLIPKAMTPGPLSTAIAISLICP